MGPIDPAGYVDSLSSRGWRPGLERVTGALADAGNPERAFKAVIVAGTNGKGSTCAVLEMLFRTHGFRTGLYTSPSLVMTNERMRVSGSAIEDAELKALVADLIPVSESRGLTQFEFLTLACLEWFRRRKVEVAVLEVGMGGRLDAVNAADPEVSVITPVGMDHELFLGRDLRSIAAEKAGIMRPGGIAVVAAQEPEAFSVFENRSRELGSGLLVEGRDFYGTPKGHGSAFGPERFDYRSGSVVLEDIELGLIGAHQVSNAACSIAAFGKFMSMAGRDTDESSMRRALREVRWPGRFELLGTDPPVVVDGAHNPHGTAALLRTLEDRVSGRPVHLVFGVLGDKDWRSMVRMLAARATDAIAAAPGNPRAADPVSVAAEFERAGIPSRAHGSLRGALADARLLARKDGGVVVVCGSLYTVGEVLKDERGKA